MTSPLSPGQFHSVFHTIRNANIDMRRSAQCARESYCPTGHAHHRARKLRLGIDLTKAARCPQSQISINPLPIIDINPSPSALGADAAAAIAPSPVLRRRPALKCVIPTSGWQSSDDELVTVALSPASAARARREHMWRAHRKSKTIADFRSHVAPRLSLDITPVFSVEAVLPCLSEPASPRTRRNPCVSSAIDRPRADVPVDVMSDMWEDVSPADGHSPGSAFSSVMTLSSSASSFGNLLCSPRGTTWYSDNRVPASATWNLGSSTSSQASSASDSMLATPENPSTVLLKRKSFQMHEGRRQSKCARMTY
ncbi:hypothetical protein HDZ31DRAFT_38957 [Schizophyllum fasciatum]